VLVSVLEMMVPAREPRAAPASLLCQFYYGWDLNLPNEAREILQRPDAGAAEVCRYRNGDVWSGVTGQPRGFNGVCQYHNYSLFRATDGQWVLDPPAGKYKFSSIFMADVQGDCPPPGDVHYVRVSGLTPGTFASLMRFLRQLSKSEPDFIAATKRLTQAQRGTDGYVTLKKWLVGQDEVTVADMLSSIQISLGWYELWLIRGWQFVRVNLDLTEEGWRIFDVGQGHLDPF